MLFKPRHAFTLVELAIVLVIIGLLVGGIMVGQELIRVAELRSVSNDLTKFETAIYAFRNKYSELPGDITTATNFWGKNMSYCSGAGGGTGSPGTCNGDGDDKIIWVGVFESRLIWQHLSLAGMIEGTYVGLPGAVSTLGVTIPKSRIAKSGYNLYACTPTGNSSVTDLNRIVFGVPKPSDTTAAAALRVEDAYSVDIKIDDGKAREGRLQASTGTGSSSACVTGGAYVFGNTGINCFLTYAVAN